MLSAPASMCRSAENDVCDPEFDCPPSDVESDVEEQPAASEIPATAMVKARENPLLLITSRSRRDSRDEPGQQRDLTAGLVTGVGLSGSHDFERRKL